MALLTCNVCNCASQQTSTPVLMPLRALISSSAAFLLLLLHASFACFFCMLLLHASSSCSFCTLLLHAATGACHLCQNPRRSMHHLVLAVHAWLTRLGSTACHLSMHSVLLIQTRSTGASAACQACTVHAASSSSCQTHASQDQVYLGVHSGNQVSPGLPVLSKFVPIRVPHNRSKASKCMR